MEEGKKVKICIEGDRLVFEQGCGKVTLALPNGVQDLYYGVYLYEEGD